jgi:hypothetical protein
VTYFIIQSTLSTNFSFFIFAQFFLNKKSGQTMQAKY